MAMSARLVSASTTTRPALARNAGEELFEKLAGVVHSAGGPPRARSTREAPLSLASWPTWLHAARALAETQKSAYPGYAIEDWLAMAKRVRLGDVDFAEVVSEGNMALIRAVDKFNVERGFANRGTFIINTAGVVRLAEEYGPGQARDQDEWRKALAAL